MIILITIDRFLIALNQTENGLKFNKKFETIIFKTHIKNGIKWELFVYDFNRQLKTEFLSKLKKQNIMNCV